MSQYKVLAQKLADGSVAPVGPNGPIILQKKLVRDPSWPDDMAPVLAAQTDAEYGAIKSILLYMSPDGSDANDGLSVEYPLKTFTRATDIARGFKGEVILYLLPGTYNPTNKISDSMLYGTNYKCRLFGRSLDFAEIRAYVPASKPVLEATGIGVACYGFTIFRNIEFHCPVHLMYPNFFGLYSCNIIQASDAESSRLLTVDGGAVCSAGTCNFKITKNLDNYSPINVTTGGYFCGYADNNMERTATGLNKYFLILGSRATCFQYEGKINFSDASGKPLSVYNTGVFYNNGNAAPAGTYMEEHAIAY